MKDLPTREVATFEAVTEQIISIVEAEVGAKDLSADSTLQSGGLDSLKVVSVIFKIEARYDICLDDEDVDDVRVGDLAAVVVRRIEEQL